MTMAVPGASGSIPLLLLAGSLIAGKTAQDVIRGSSFRVVDVVKESEFRGAAEAFVDGFFLDRTKSDVSENDKKRAGSVLQRYIDAEFKFQYTNGKRGTLLQAKMGGQVVGCGGVHVQKMMLPDGQSDVAIIANLAVVKAARRRGVAERLIAQLETATRALGFDEVRLMVSKNNRAARGLYKKLGYRDVCDYKDMMSKEVKPGGRVVDGYEREMVLMTKNLRVPFIPGLQSAIIAGGVGVATAAILEHPV
jgi:ribosomal protein S18 acetylase RimI-like enzyme